MTDKQKNQILRLRADGLGYGKVAQELGISVNTVKSFCRRNSAGSKPVEKSQSKLSGEVTLCENCGTEIQQILKRKKKRFCCDKCRNAWWNRHLDTVKRKSLYTFICPHCGREFTVYGDKRRKYCSHECYIADRFGGGKDE